MVSRAGGGYLQLGKRSIEKNVFLLLFAMQRCVVAALNPWLTRRPNSLHAEVAGHDITVLPPLMVGTGGTEKGHCYQNDLPHDITVFPHLTLT